MLLKHPEQSEDFSYVIWITIKIIDCWVESVENRSKRHEQTELGNIVTQKDKNMVATGQRIETDKQIKHYLYKNLYLVRSNTYYPQGEITTAIRREMILYETEFV